MTDGDVAGPAPVPSRPDSRGSGRGRLVGAVPVESRCGVAVADTAPPWLRVPGLVTAALDDRSARAPSAAVPAPRPAARPAAGRPSISRPPASRARPQVVVEDGILGLSRRARSRVGSRLFTLFFVAVYALILGQLLFVLVHG